MSEWIKVSERLPEFKYGCGYCLVATSSGAVEKTFFNLSRQFGSLQNKCYSRKRQGKNSGYFELSHKYGYEITHWMPLPAAPEAE